MIGSAGFFENFHLLHNTNYFDNTAKTNPLLHIWSLGVEEQFYLFWPLLLWTTWKCRINFLLVLILIAVSSFVFNLCEIKDHAIATFYSPFTRFWELTSGALLAWIHLRNQKKEKHIYSTIFSIFGLIFLIFGFLFINENISFPGYSAILPVLGAVFIINAGPKTFLNRVILSNRIFVWFGLISFPLYLWHWPLLVFERITENTAPSETMKVTAILLSIFLAWITYQFIEKPIRVSRYSKNKIILLVLLMITIIGISAETIAKKGFVFRQINKLNQTINNTLSYKPEKDFRTSTCFLDPNKENKYASFCGLHQHLKKPLIMLWGDSYAASLYQGFLASSRKFHFDLAQFTASGCPPILNFIVANRKNCLYLNNLVYHEIQRSKPDILVMAGYWSLYDGGQKWEVLDTQKLIITIEKMKRLGIQHIILIGHLPTYNNNQIDLLKRSYKGEKISIRTYHNFKTSVFSFNKKIEAVAKKTGVEFINPLSILCNKRGCLLSTSKTKIIPLSFDQGHLTKQGSIYVVSQFFKENLIPIKK